jgi:hypothetical protein
MLEHTYLTEPPLVFRRPPAQALPATSWQREFYMALGVAIVATGLAAASTTLLVLEKTAGPVPAAAPVVFPAIVVPLPQFGEIQQPRPVAAAPAMDIGPLIKAREDHADNLYYEEWMRQIAEVEAQAEAEDRSIANDPHANLPPQVTASH